MTVSGAKCWPRNQIMGTSTRLDSAAAHSSVEARRPMT